jgi:membrane-associated phospholipid phosphatase
MVVFPALVWLAWAIRRQRYADADVSVRHHRYGFYAFGLGCLLLCHGTLAWSGAPAVLRAGVVAAMLAVASGALANRFWGKVSIHAGALTGIAAVSSLYSLPLALALGILAAVVAWARVAMGRHTVVQTLAGGLLALVCVLTVLWPWR